MTTIANPNRQVRYQVANYRGIRVAYQPHLDGGGSGFGQVYVPVVRTLFGRIGRVYEFCAGPGFIGFSLLAHGLCDSLCLSDINPEAVKAARETVRRNGLESRVSVYESDALDQIPESESWDLVVSNPPHFKDEYEGSIRHYDANWEIHRRFYADVVRHLNPSASVLIQENYDGSEASDFDGMISSSGLQRLPAFMYANRGQRNYCDNYYFVCSQKNSIATHIRPAQDCIVDTESCPTIIEIQLDVNRSPTIRLEAFKRHRLRFNNSTEHKLTLSLYVQKFGFVPRFLRSLGEMAPVQTELNRSLVFAPGIYLVRCPESRIPLYRLKVE